MFCLQLFVPQLYLFCFLLFFYCPIGGWGAKKCPESHKRFLGCWTCVPRFVLFFPRKCQHRECVGQSGRACCQSPAFTNWASPLSLYLTSQGCNDRPAARSRSSSSKCRREYDLMMGMSPTWGFWQRRMVQGEGAWAKRAQITPNGTQSGLLCCRICSFISRTSPALDHRDYTCWKDACATGRLHPSPRCQPRSAWRSRYGQRVRAQICAPFPFCFVVCQTQRCIAECKITLWATIAWDVFFFLNTCVCSLRMPFHDDLEFSAAEATQGFALLNCYLCNPCMALMHGLQK